MKAVNDTYPVYEANQVLSNVQLNQESDFVNEQERLTRANLIGIGIACGLALRLDDASTTLHLSPGCGITTEGYLAVESDPVALTSYREYNLPLDVDYPLLRDKSTAGHPPYPLWELFPAGEPDTTALGSPASFLDNKAVLLFIELKKEGLRTCSPNDCNDRGSQVVVTVRRLLIATTDLDKVIAEGAEEGSGLTMADLEARMQERLKLPDLRLPRIDVPGTAPTTSEHVLAAFRAVFHDAQLATNTGAALSAAWQAFKPLLVEQYPADPFAGFGDSFGFLDNAYGNAAQIAFLPYYYDLFDDLLRAYDEMRWKGVELACACVPSELLFPRHLMLGVPRPSGIDPALYRHGFEPACAGELQRDEFLLLFRRLAGMVESFTYQPPLPAPDNTASPDRQIRITPSMYGAGLLEEKALPYYYELKAEAPLYQAWSPVRSRRRRANQNLGYRSSEYTPTAPDFVLDPLRFDLEPHDFLRIEGHLGKQYQPVLNTLLTLKTRYRLPIEVLALRTGAFDENAPLADNDTAKFPDLETLYDVLREELLTTLSEGVRYLYDVPANTALPGGVPKHPLLKQRAPQFAYDANTVGAWYEKYLAGFLARPYIDVDQNKIDANAILMVYCSLFTGTTGLAGEFFAHAVSIYYMSKLAETLPASLDAMAYADFENKCQDLLGLTHHFRDEQGGTVAADLKQFVPQEELIDHFDQVLYGCNLEAMRALHDEFLRRMRELKQQQVLAYFLQKHPGIEHKAGVPLGGTFVLVYHEGAAKASLVLPPITNVPIKPAVVNRVAIAPRIGRESLLRAVQRLGSDIRYAQDPDIQVLIGSLAGVNGGILIPTDGEGNGKTPIADMVAALANGTVIADFYLPYRVAGEGAGIQYVLPVPPLGLSVTLGCTDDSGNAQASLIPEGGMQPISYQLDGQPYKALTETVLLTVGEHTLSIRDSAGAESAPQTVSVPSPLRLDQESYADDPVALTWKLSVPITGGVLPYASDAGKIDINVYTSDPVPSGQALNVVVRDSAGCETSREYQHVVPRPCDLPNKGIAWRNGYRFWLPDADTARPFSLYAGTKVEAFNFEYRDGKKIDLRGDVEQLLSATTVDDLNKNYDKVVRTWVKKINELVAGAIASAAGSAVGSTDWLVLDYDTKTSGMPVLWIEAFDKLAFDIKLQPSFRRPGTDGTVRFAYAPTTGSTILIGDGKEVVVPFNPSRIDKCDPARPVTQVCAALDLQLKIGVKRDGTTVLLDVTPSGTAQPTLFTWEVQDCTPALVSGKSAKVTMVAQTPPVKAIRLCAYTKEGCMMVATSQLNVG